MLSDSPGNPVEVKSLSMNILPFVRITAAAIAIALANPLSPVLADDLFEVFEAHCVKCHGKDGKVKGKVNLREFKSGVELQGQPELIEKLIAVLKDHEMPPDDEPELKNELREWTIIELIHFFDEAVAAQGFAPTPIRRMNRFQFNNAVVDLLELDRDIFTLPEKLMRRYSDYFHPETNVMPASVKVASRPMMKDVDNARAEGFMGVGAFPQDLRAEHGFDNRADHLTLSPLLMESFLKLSHTIVESSDLNSQECRSWNQFFVPPKELAAGQQLLAIRERMTPFLRRAFRSPVDEDTLERFMAFAETQIAAGADFTEVMKTLVGAVFASPEFLYLYDGGETSDFDLASRLSFFFWGSVPDDELLDLAETGKLRDPKVLGEQIDRMLNDDRISRFCDSFPGQWMQLDRLISSLPNQENFSHFYHNTSYRVSMHMMLEPLLLFETVLIENRSITDLLAPDFTWRSKALDGAYEGKISNGEVKVITFNRVLVTDPKRGGVITSAAVLTMTSGSERTTPITRGAWVNTVIFNDPPEPPPADVPPLPEANEEELAKLTMRERFEAHRSREDCAGCHRQIDPLGFALENFDPTGVWREKYENGREIDPSGEIFGHKFETALEFREVLLKEKRRFIRGFSAHLLSFALSRELTPSDSPALDEITRKAMAGDDGLRTILKMVALSDPFLQNN
ncbi:MAG: hypothetical protein ACI8UO_002753 [Verrucomicrobiales bacterium]